ncbi:interferon regulatory factor 4-like [Myripristis murdjan]|uniref:Interferon regulatory factor 4-like n=1 Tax=Myripristis murdjan TaxID=586833 RepID=A0A667YIG0_9TELE|nr:interferon regulatory factor 4-like [Myripristis murdjan]
MNTEADYGGSGSSGNGKLRQWLIEQVDCGKYPGLVWENDEKSIFRIPWKHAGKQDYNRDEDAALFKAWALFKGKFREGIDKPDPPTWKTRLRCALNKSNDFEELVDRSQLDISDPYKVYRIIPEGAKKRPKQEDSPLSSMSYPMHASYPALQTQMPGYIPTPECGWRDFFQEPTSLPEMSFAQCPYPPRSLPWQSSPMENGYQIKASIYSYSPADSQPSPFTLDASMRSAEAFSDFRLHVTVYYRDTLIREVTTSSPEGCHIAPCSPEDKPYLPPGGPELVPLPVESPPAQRRADECPPSPPSSMERGVLLWMAPDGLYARRLCQGRVYWQGGLSPYGDKPNKLEREVTCKLLHTQDYLTELQSYSLHGRPLPRFQVLLSFGDECLDPQRQRRILSVQVEPLVARQLLYYAQQTGGHYYRTYDHPGVTDHMSPSEDYQRAITHHHSSSLQE